ncbi:MAG: lytic transglycosylase domain-containing protein [Oryzomicrobium sp.]|nr:lytic transglycosylase domain-containing protein [Oryzomicrobium sp.]
MRHRIPSSLIRAILAVEGGAVGQTVHNRNGSVDIGPMQINSIWLPEIERRGGSLSLIRDHFCANIQFGTWLLARELGRLDITQVDRQAFWRAVGNYHSRTPELNSRYAERVWNAWRRQGG